MRTIVDDDHRIEIIARDPEDEICRYDFIGSARIESVNSLNPTLVDVYVRPEARREGVATEMTVRAMIWAREERKSLRLYVAPHNEGAQALYEGLGWAYTGAEEVDGSLWMKMPEMEVESS